MRRIISIATFLFLTSFSYAKDYVITDYGAINDGTTLNTKNIQKTIDLASANGGGKIVIPAGNFLTGALFFRQNTTLEVKEGAVLKGSDNIKDYPYIPSRMEGQNLYYYAALINAYNVDNFSINGPGKIDGNGLTFWKSFWDTRKKNPECTNLEVPRPRLVFIWGCNNVKIKDVKLHNSGFWTTHLYQCNTILIENCDIRSPHKPVAGPSTDAIDLDVCKDVIIRGCYISVNDDGICIKGGKGPKAHELYENGITENVLIEDCEFDFVHATLTMGSESIHARNITMRNCKVNHYRTILRLKNRPDTYQIYENITIENITGKCKDIINVNPWKQFYDMKGDNAQPYCIIRNIVFNNIDVECQSIGVIKGNPNDMFSNITFKNMNIKAEKKGIDTTVKGIKIKNVFINGEKLKKKDVRK